MNFPDGFLWGAATAAYQIEGAALEGGKGPSVWDVFCRRPGAVYDGHTGEVACDHYHRYREDVALFRQMGLKAYRFSVAWPRVLPDGVGEINRAGLDFYCRLVDELLTAGIQPWVTLFHWDYPHALYCRGGWLNRESPEWFAQYARAVVEALSDRVQHWMTLNEPQCFIGLGHGDGTHAPGVKLGLPDQLLAAHHALVAHGRAVQVIREHAREKPFIGWAPVGLIRHPATDSPADIEAARRATFSVSSRDMWNNTWFSDPVCLGRYPEDGLRLFGADVPADVDRDLPVIREPLDFYGVNIYNGHIMRAGPNGEAELVNRPPGQAQTRFNWPVDPESLYWGPRFLYERYRLPVYVTENGMSGLDWVALDGHVRDPQRIDYTHRYLIALHRAIRAGADVRGYFHWSALDNFEWAEGYRQRFGLIYVDYPTQQRIPKESARWYAGLICANGPGSIRPR